MIRCTRFLIPVLCLLIWSAPASAQTVIEIRQQGMRVLQSAVNRLLELETAPPAAYRPNDVAEQFYIVREVLPSLNQLFPNSRSARGGRASPVIWQLRRPFDRLFVEAQRRAAEGFTAARRMGGARPAVQSALKGLTQTCATCHNQFIRNW